jgi:hypothetical protein
MIGIRRAAGNVIVDINDLTAGINPVENFRQIFMVGDFTVIRYKSWLPSRSETITNRFPSGCQVA